MHPMRKTIFFTLALLLGVTLLTTEGWTYTFPNNTLVQEWNVNAKYGSGPWMDVIGEPALFDTYGANLSGNTLTIFSNWGPSWNGAFASYTNFGGVKTADLFIDVGKDGTFDYAIQLDTTTGKGWVYVNPLDIITSQQIFSHASGWFNLRRPVRLQ